MNKFVYALPLVFAFACGDKDDDTAAEEVEAEEVEAEDTGDTGEEADGPEDEGAE